MSRSNCCKRIQALGVFGIPISPFPVCIVLQRFAVLHGVEPRWNASVRKKCQLRHPEGHVGTVEVKGACVMYNRATFIIRDISFQNNIHGPATSLALQVVRKVDTPIQTHTKAHTRTHTLTETRLRTCTHSHTRARARENPGMRTQRHLS